jgi:hypothetical protein
MSDLVVMRLRKPATVVREAKVQAGTIRAMAFRAASLRSGVFMASEA